MIGQVESLIDMMSAPLAASTTVNPVVPFVGADGDVDMVHGPAIGDDFERLRLQPPNRRTLVSFHLEIHGLAPGVLGPLPGSRNDRTPAIA